MITGWRLVSDESTTALLREARRRGSASVMSVSSLRGGVTTVIVIVHKLK